MKQTYSTETIVRFTLHNVKLYIFIYLGMYVPKRDLINKISIRIIIHLLNVVYLLITGNYLHSRNYSNLHCKSHYFTLFSYSIYSFLYCSKLCISFSFLTFCDSYFSFYNFLRILPLTSSNSSSHILSYISSFFSILQT